MNAVEISDDKVGDSASSDKAKRYSNVVEPITTGPLDSILQALVPGYQVGTSEPLENMGWGHQKQRDHLLCEYEQTCCDHVVVMQPGSKCEANPQVIPNHVVGD